MGQLGIMLPHHRKVILVKRVLPVLWISFIYLLVHLTEGHVPSPPWGTWERMVFEARNTSIHISVFAVQVWLTARAVDVRASAQRRDVVVLVLLGTLLGIGIEFLQWVGRPDYAILEGVWDIFSDFLGAVAGWAIYRRLGQVERNPVQI